MGKIHSTALCCPCIGQAYTLSGKAAANFSPTNRKSNLIKLIRKSSIHREDLCNEQRPKMHIMGGGDQVSWQPYLEGICMEYSFCIDVVLLQFVTMCHFYVYLHMGQIIN